MVWPLFSDDDDYLEGNAGAILPGKRFFFNILGLIHAMIEVSFLQELIPCLPTIIALNNSYSAFSGPLEAEPELPMGYLLENLSDLTQRP